MRFRNFAAASASLVALPLIPSTAHAETPTAPVRQALPISYSLGGTMDLAAAAAASSPATGAAPAAAPAQQQSREEINEEWTKWRRTQAAARKWEFAYLTLSAIDAAQTIDCLNRNVCHEANPLFGKHPSTGKILAIKGIGSVVQYLLFNKVNERNPKAALRVAQFGVALQGTVVALNTRFMF